MKLLTLTTDMPPMRGGVARYTDALCRYFSDSMTVVTNVEADNVTPYTRHREPEIMQRRWPHWMGALKVLGRYSADYLLVQHVIPMGLVALLHKRRTETPYIVFLHGMDFLLATRNPWKRFLTKRVLTGAHTIVTTTRSLADEVQAFCGRESLIVPPLPGIRSSDSVKPRKASKKVELLSVSRLVERKGIQRIISALASDAELANTASYTIAGTGPYEAALRSLVEQHNLQDAVHFVGDVDDTQLTELYRKADLFVLPTISSAQDREGFGIVYLEAASFGVPSVASDIPGVNEAIIDGETGVLVGSDSELTEALKNLLADADLRNRLGSQAARRVQKTFTEDRVYKPLKERLAL